MWQVFADSWTDDSGQDVAEYALLMSLLLVLTVALIKSIGTAAGSIFQLASDVLTQALN